MSRLLRSGLMLLLGIALSLSAAAQDVVRQDIASIRRRGEDKQILIATHRGGLWHRFPENSLEAIRAALKLGADFIEVDVRKTKDGALILMHDQTLDRCTNGKGRVSDYTLAEIKGLCLRDKNKRLTSYRVPTLKEALLVMKGKVFIKVDKYNEEQIFDRILDLLRETGTARQASFRVGLNHKKFRKTYGAAAGTVHFFPALEGDSLRGDLTAKTERFQTRVNPVVFQAKFKDSTSFIVPRMLPINRAGYHVWVMSTRPYYCGGWDDAVSLKDPERGWGRLITHGVTIIETDHPEELRYYLKSKNLHP
ncbi:glycerophosphodiester phosphodiesterase family protein [Pedobacter sp. SYP-B3415]|uniref:glycerophosphodiester phosphodiesterase family protein n=1 Tax=Pedobacter sp. SYP-B3415 TaxID=2496641 RepID=UPI0013EB5021|nr:glycerophosphodiester phosphodiesterase family protein [Pedobacter sp. SYP-B3415]